MEKSASQVGSARVVEPSVEATPRLKSARSPVASARCAAQDGQSDGIRQDSPPFHVHHMRNELAWTIPRDSGLESWTKEESTLAVMTLTAGWASMTPRSEFPTRGGRRDSGLQEANSNE